MPEARPGRAAAEATEAAEVDGEAVAGIHRQRDIH